MTGLTRVQSKDPAFHLNAIYQFLGMVNTGAVKRRLLFEDTVHQKWMFKGSGCGVVDCPLLSKVTKELVALSVKLQLNKMLDNVCNHNKLEG